MSILRRDFEDLFSLREMLDRLLVDPLARPINWVEGRIMGGVPAVDVYETDEAFIVKAVVPGVKPEDLTVSVMGGVLTIKGEVKEESEVEEACYICKERRYGSFSRSVDLPASVNVDAANAEFEHGVLKLTLPKTEAVKPKSIKITAK